MASIVSFRDEKTSAGGRMPTWVQGEKMLRSGLSTQLGCGLTNPGF